MLDEGSIVNKVYRMKVGRDRGRGGLRGDGTKQVTFFDQKCLSFQESGRRALNKY